MPEAIAAKSTAGEVWDALRQDIHDIAETDGRWAAVRTAVGATATAAVTVPYLFGGLEATLTTVGARIYEATHSLPAVSAGMGVTSGLIEGALTLGVAHYMGRADRVTDVLRERKYQEQTAAGEADADRVDEAAVAVQGTRRGVFARLMALPSTVRQKAAAGTKTAALAFTAGSPGIMFREFARHPDAGEARFRRAGLKTAAVLTGVNTVIGTAYDGMLEATTVLDRLHPGLTQDTINTATNPLFWGGVFVFLNNMVGPLSQAARRTAAEIGRTLVYRGDELPGQQLAAELDYNQELLEGTHFLAAPRAEASDASTEPETPKPRLHPHALEFLQTVYGHDRRLDDLPRETATLLINRLLHEYGVHYDDETRFRTLFDNAEYIHAGSAVADYASGAEIADIVELYAGNIDALDVEIMLNDIASRLRRHDADQRLAAPDEPFLEGILEYYAGPVDELFPRRHIVPIGQPLTPIIEHSQGTPAWQQLQEDLERDVDEVEEQYLERMAQDAEWAVYEYAATSEFRRAAARKGHTKDGEVFVVGPGDNDEDSRVLRHMAWLTATAVFARKDGNTLEDMQEHMDDDHDFHMLAVDQSGEFPQPMGALHTKMQSENSLPSVQDIGYEWHEPIRQTLLEAGLPDLRYYPHVLDILHIAVLPKYLSGGANLALYNRFGVLGNVLGAEFMVNVFDKDPAAELNKYGNAFKPYGPNILPINYKARRKNANSSLPRAADNAAWQADLAVSNPRAYANFWGLDPTIGKRYQLPKLDRFAHLNRQGHTDDGMMQKYDSQKPAHSRSKVESK